MQLIQNYSQDKKLTLDPKKLEEIITREDRMDKFVHLLSYLSQVGVDTPLSTVHWVLAANRLIKLGEKVRVSPESSIRWMLGMKKMGLPLSVFNAGKDITEKVSSVVKSNLCKEKFK
jgi:hypothetical protein